MDEISRRDFVKQSALGTLILAGAASEVLAMAAPLDVDLRHQIVAALGDVFVPSASGDPGYKDLEKYGISDYVLKNNFPEGNETLGQFNETAKEYFDGKRFLDLDEKQK